MKAKYGLSVTPAERDAITRVLAGCPDQPRTARHHALLDHASTSTPSRTPPSHPARQPKRHPRPDRHPRGSGSVLRELRRCSRCRRRPGAPGRARVRLAPGPRRRRRRVRVVERLWIGWGSKRRPKGRPIAAERGRSWPISRLVVVVASGGLLPLARSSNFPWVGEVHPPHAAIVWPARDHRRASPRQPRGGDMTSVHPRLSEAVEEYLHLRRARFSHLYCPERDLRAPSLRGQRRRHPGPAPPAGARREMVLRVLTESWSDTGPVTVEIASPSRLRRTTTTEAASSRSLRYCCSARPDTSRAAPAGDPHEASDQGSGSSPDPRCSG